MDSLFLIAYFISHALSASVTNLQTTYDLPEDLPFVSQLGQLVECTAQEKQCFQHGRIYNVEDERCYVIGSQGNCTQGKLYLDKKAAVENGSYVGKCVFHEPCGDYEVKTENGTCLSADYFCGSKRKILRSLFGDPSCVPDSYTVPLVEVRQPEEKSLCRVPDFRNADIPYPSPDLSKVSCSEQENLCFLHQRVLWPGDGQCYDILHTEPCEEGNWLVIDKQEYIQAQRAVPICYPRPCPQGEVMLQLDGTCHKEEEVLDIWCSGKMIYTNAFGESGCSELKPMPSLFPSARWNGFCRHSLLWKGINKRVLGFFSRKVCPQGGRFHCARMVEQPEMDLPEL